MFVGGEKGSLRRQTRNGRSKSEHFLIPSEFYRKVFPSILGSLNFKVSTHMVLGRDFSNEQLVLMVVGAEKQNVIIRKSLFKQIE